MSAKFVRQPKKQLKINIIFMKLDEDEDEDMESRGSGFVVLNDVSQACTSCWEWSFGGDHA